jgi:hypothetical protein
MNFQRIFKILFVVVIICALFSCQKEVYIDLPEPDTKLVVEGWIEQDQFAVVSVTRNSPYFSKVDSTTLASLFILNAQVYVSDGIQTEKLELDYSNALKGIWPFICYKGSVIRGEIGKNYSLVIYAEGDTITGLTTIPDPVVLDSIWWIPDNQEKPENDSLGYLWATYTDDPAIKQYFRLFSNRLGRDKDWVPLFGSTFDDIFFNGITFTFSMYRGVPSLTDIDAIENDKELFYFKMGDTVDIKVTSIDREHYDFWRTVEQEFYSGGNPFIFPAVIRHNVQGALGVWGGYAAMYYRVIPGQ